jgi:hypothetical protein
MRSYCGDGYRQIPDGKLLGRIAEGMKHDDVEREAANRAEFNRQYTSGKVVMRLASKYMHLKDCGLGRFLEANTKIVWSLSDGAIVRQKEDLNWVDEYLSRQGE